MNKKLVSALMGSGMVLAAFAPAFAADCANGTTGAGSVNGCKVKVKKVATLDLTNLAWTKNKTAVDTNSGGNKSIMNTAGGSIDTSTADGTVNQTTDANANIVDIDQTPGATVGNGENAITGAHSYNKVKIVNRKSADVTISNDATVRNIAHVTTNTGDNKEKENTIGGDITTGAATSSVTQSTTVNGNMVTIVQ